MARASKHPNKKVSFLKEREYFSVIVILIAVVWINLYVLPLKPLGLMHWDESVRYGLPAFDGSSILRNGMDNGRINLLCLMVLNQLFSWSVQTKILIFKNIVLFFNIGVLFFYCKNILKTSSWFWPYFCVICFLLTPMVWIESNENMVEPLALGMMLLWITQVSEAYRTVKKDLKEKSRFFLTLTAVGYLFVLESFQFFLIFLGISGLVLFLILFFEYKNKKKSLTEGFFLLAFVGMSGLISLWLWFMTHSGTISEQIYYLNQMVFGEAGNSHPELANGMNRFQILTFGLRCFCWMYFPAIFLIPIAIGYIYKNAEKFDFKGRYVLLVSGITPFIFAYGYQGNTQDRYHYLPNILVLIVILLGIFSFVEDVLVGKVRFRLFGTLPILVFILFYISSEYLPIYQSLGCLANNQVFGIYAGDRAECSEIRALFGSVKRTSLVEYPHLDYRTSFPNSQPGQDNTPLFKALEKAINTLEKEFMPVAMPNNPNYFCQSSLLMHFLQKFGELPQKQISDSQWIVISLSFPAQSIFNNVVYSHLEHHSDEAALSQWRREVEPQPHEILVDERTPDYTLLIAKVRKN